MRKPIQSQTPGHVLLFLFACLGVAAGACTTGEGRSSPRPEPASRAPEPVETPVHGRLGLFAQFLLAMSHEGYPEAYVTGHALFEEGVALHEKDDFAGAADRFLRAAAAYATTPPSSPDAELLLKNRDLSCANARVAFLNGGLTAELARAADRLAVADPECVKQLKK